MNELHYIIAGIAQIIIGIILIYKRKEIISLVANSQKDVNRVLGRKKEEPANKIKHHFFPNFIIILIGFGLSIIGILAIIMAY